MASYQHIKDHFDLNIVPQCAKICRTISSTSEKDSIRDLKNIRDMIEREVLLPLESVLGSDPAARNNGVAFRQSIDELITYLSNKISFLDPDNGSLEDLELGINKSEAQKAVLTWGWLESMPGAWPNPRFFENK
ncbi:hypothetical protein ANO14919_011460 [Xylariales sp. No.14919]|nr:hypothetical protein ANO14919_011460 [Xylariales sp. No.14919]